MNKLSKVKGFKTPMSIPSLSFSRDLNPRLKMSLILNFELLITCSINWSNLTKSIK